MNEDLDPAARLAVELLARAIHKEHADRLPGTAPFERCPHRADELAEARLMTVTS